MYKGYTIIDYRLAGIHERFAIAKWCIHSCDHYAFTFTLTNLRQPVSTSHANSEVYCAIYWNLSSPAGYIWYCTQNWSMVSVKEAFDHLKGESKIVWTLPCQCGTVPPNNPEQTVVILTNHHWITWVRDAEFSMCHQTVDPLCHHEPDNCGGQAPCTYKTTRLLLEES